jgi:ankyrin repeat protein
MMQHGWTALHAAAAKGHIECVRLLLEGVTVNGSLVRANPAIGKS